MDHSYWMREALKEAELALVKKEVPIGAVVVQDNKIIGRGHNQIESLKDPTAHAEMVAITSASHTLNSWRLNNATLYVTVEPCPMCAGAIMVSRLSCCVFGTADQKLGSLGTVYKIKNAKIEIISGVLELECKIILQRFFKNLRPSVKSK